MEVTVFWSLYDKTIYLLYVKTHSYYLASGGKLQGHVQVQVLPSQSEDTSVAHSPFKPFREVWGGAVSRAACRSTFCTTVSKQPRCCVSSQSPVPPATPAHRRQQTSSFMPQRSSRILISVQNSSPNAGIVYLPLKHLAVARHSIPKETASWAGTAWQALQPWQGLSSTQGVLGGLLCMQRPELTLLNL